MRRSGAVIRRSPHTQNAGVHLRSLYSAHLRFFSSTAASERFEVYLPTVLEEAGWFTIELRCGLIFTIVLIVPAENLRHFLQGKKSASL